MRKLWRGGAAFRRRSTGLVASLGALLVAGPFSMGISAAAQKNPSQDPALCMQIAVVDRAVDYRLRESTPQLNWEFNDNTRYHFEPAMRNMQQGEYSRRVLADLDFLVARWPNHHPALRLIIEYELAGGKPYNFAGPQCYLLQARRFSPDDVNVVLLQGFYLWKKGDVRAAQAAYREALDLDPSSAEAHYNLGLLYLETKEFDKAREHAVAAYAAGHPLPGLRRKLAQAGHPITP